MIELSIIIVNFNTKDLLLASLHSLLDAKTRADEWEVIVVDNGSKDMSIQSLKSWNEKVNKRSIPLSIIENKDNAGFAKGNNQGIRKAKGRYVLLLNSDTEVQKKAIQVSLQFLKDNKSAGAVTCKLQLPDGRMDPACHRGFPTPWAAFTYVIGLEKLFPRSGLFARYHMGYEDLTQPHRIDSPSGAFFLVKKETIDTVGLLDEAYFMYGEDIDWAYRIKQGGWDIWFIPAVWVLHKKKQSGRGHENKLLRKQTQVFFYETMKIFYGKHYRQAYPLFITWLVIAILNMRIFFLRNFSI